MKGLTGREIFKNYTKSICKFLIACIVAVVIFFAGGLFESFKHPAIVQEQGITTRELRSELQKRKEFSLQMDSEWDLAFYPDTKFPVWYIMLEKRPLTQLQKEALKARQKAVESKSLSISGTGDEGIRKIEEGK